MSGKSKQFTAELQVKARQLLDASGADITGQVMIRPLAKQLVADTGCNIDTAKQHVARAIRRARGDWVGEREQGGRREGAGRPPNEPES